MLDGRSDARRDCNMCIFRAEPASHVGHCCHGVPRMKAVTSTTLFHCFP